MSETLTPVRLLHEILQLLKRLPEDRPRLMDDRKVVEVVPPEILEKFFPLSQTPLTSDQLIEEIQRLLRYSVDPTHPARYGESGSSPIGWIAELVTSYLDASVETYAQAPVFSVMEKEIEKKILKLVGWGPSQSRMLWTSHLQESHTIAFGLAQRRFNVNQRKFPVIYLSDQADPSFWRMFHLLGWKKSQLEIIPTNLQGQIELESLELRLQTPSYRHQPVMVVGTAGTHLQGSFDPLDEIATLCRKYRVWFHVDAHLGGGMLWHTRTRHLLAGLEEADSISWTPHLMMKVGKSSTWLLLKQQSQLQIFTKLQDSSECYDSSRDHPIPQPRSELLKFWFLFQTQSDAERASQMEQLAKLHQIALQLVKEDPELLLIQDGDSPFINFWYWPMPLPKVILEQIHTRLRQPVAQAEKFQLQIRSNPRKFLFDFCHWRILNPQTSSLDLVNTLTEFKKIAHQVVKEIRYELIHRKPLSTYYERKVEEIMSREDLKSLTLPAESSESPSTESRSDRKPISERRRFRIGRGHSRRGSRLPTILEDTIEPESDSSSVRPDKLI